MATVKIIRKIEKQRKDGRAPLYIRIIKDRTPKYVSLGILVTEKEWKPDTNQVISKYPNSARVNKVIAAKLLEAHKLSVDLEDGKKITTNKKIKEDIMGKGPKSFFDYADAYVDSLENTGRVGVHRKDKAIIKKLKDYRKSGPLMFHEITYTFLKEYEEHMRVHCENGTNTIHGNFKVIRKIMNDACNDDTIDRNSNPFYKFKLTTEPSNREFLSEEELLAVENCKLPEGSKLNDHRNAYIFAAYAGGLRISDILQLKWNNFDGDHINLVMHKTGRQLIIKLPKKAIEIINRYKHEGSQSDDFVFPFLRNDKDYSEPKVLHYSIASATTLANKSLDSIRKKLKWDKHISFHTSRHTFATRALRKGMRIEYVSKILGHSNIKETQVYAKIVNEELDKAMEIFDL
jgi:integrase/recombinase XerD